MQGFFRIILYKPNIMDKICLKLNILTMFINILQVLNALNNDSGWNPMFNREKQIPKIERRLKIDLSDIKRNNYSNNFEF